MLRLLAFIEDKPSRSQLQARLGLTTDGDSGDAGVVLLKRPMIELVRGNLLDAEAEALVNTVNTVGVMGRGIALQFKKAFPDNFREYARACKAHDLKPGGILTHVMGGFSLPRYVINVATKEHWRGNSRMEYVEHGLEELAREVVRLRIGSVAVPPLGCGLGGLDWAQVYPRIVRAFAQLPEVRVLVYEPAGVTAESLTAPTSPRR